MRIYRDITVPPAVRNERPRIFKQTNEQTGETARTNTHIDSNKNDKKSERNTKKNTHNNQQHTVTTGWEESFVPKWISAFGKKWQNKWLGPLNSSVGKRAIVATAEPQNNVTFCLEYVCIRISRSPCMRFVCYVLGCSCWMLCFFLFSFSLCECSKLRVMKTAFCMQFEMRVVVHFFSVCSLFLVVIDVVVVVVVVIVFSSCSFHSFLLYVLMLQSATKRIFSDVNVVATVSFIVRSLSNISWNKWTRNRKRHRMNFGEQRHIDTGKPSRAPHISNQTKILALDFDFHNSCCCRCCCSCAKVCLLHTYILNWESRTKKKSAKIIVFFLKRVHVILLTFSYSNEAQESKYCTRCVSRRRSTLRVALYRWFEIEIWKMIYWIENVRFYSNKSFIVFDDWEKESSKSSALTHRQLSRACKFYYR